LHVGQQLRRGVWSVGWLAAVKACAINSATINSTGVGCVRDRWLADLSRKRLVYYKHQAPLPTVRIVILEEFIRHNHLWEILVISTRTCEHSMLWHHSWLDDGKGIQPV